MNIPTTECKPCTYPQESTVRVGDKSIITKKLLQLEPSDEGMSLERRSIASSAAATCLNQIVFNKNKIPVENRTRDYFDANIGSLLSSSEILSGCDCLLSSTVFFDGSSKKKIKDFFCQSKREILYIPSLLEKDELAFVVYKRDWTKSDYSITFFMLSNASCEDHVSIITSETYLNNPEYLESFAIKLDIYFNPDNRLDRIVLLRGVNPKFQRNGICTKVTRNSFKVIDLYLGEQESKVMCCTASHIGTVKFFYPLNKYYHRITGEHLRDLHPVDSLLRISDFTASHDDLSAFFYNPNVSTSARCLHESVPLKKLLSQLQLKDILNKLPQVTRNITLC